MCRVIAALFAIAGTALFGHPWNLRLRRFGRMLSAYLVRTRRRAELGRTIRSELSNNGPTLKALLGDAFNLKHYQISGPDWLDADQYRYDIDAKIPKDTTKEQFRSMLQHLLVERFQLTLHREVREVAAYSLVVGRMDRRSNRPD